MAADPAAPVTAAAPPLELGLLLVDDDDEDDGPMDVVLLVTAAAAGAGAEDDEDDGVDDVSVPGVLSGAFGWPPSSGDGAILESVKRREIISGRQKPPRVAPSTGLYLVLRGASSKSLITAGCSGSLSLSLSCFISEIYTSYIHTCYFYVLFYCYFLLLLLSECFFFFYFTLLFGDFFFLRCCATATAQLCSLSLPLTICLTRTHFDTPPLVWRFWVCLCVRHAV